ARDVALVAGDAVARAHGAAGQFPAGAVVVAHLDRALEPIAGAGIGRPVEMGREVFAAIAGRVAEHAAVVELRRAHDLAGIVESVRIETILDLLERAREARAEHRLLEFRGHPARALL